MLNCKLVRVRQIGLTKTHFITGVFCLALGALGGGAFVSHHAENVSKGKQVVQQQLTEEHAALIAENDEIKSQLQTFKEDSNIEKQKQSTLEQTVAASKKTNTQLKKQNQTLSVEVANLKTQLKEQQNQALDLQKQNQVLQASIDKKNAILTQSKEYFQGQLKLQQEVHELNVQREKLIVTFNNLTKECQVFTEGKSWDAKSDSCDRKQKASDRIKALDKSINAKQAQLDSADSAVK
ncbi:hypothetical protein [Vibrio sp. B1Z05]|uniref:hypothetical protein n=1 Tax=Vibrio sp. B1Z05 TaxID=2654980 RepID=UPI00128C471E|nr:hypothetical protein [Vibrio sp. B1Z05]MPW35706.1 hypothetical protein [Vibrio sp. B1Z05]